MSDMIADGIEYLDDVRKSYVSQSVVYARGGSTLSIVATPSQQEHAVDNLDGTITTLVSTSWIITVADLSSLAPPKRGDQVRWTRSGTTHVYEVMGPGGSPVYEDADPYQQCYKVHTKYVGPS